MRPKFNIFVISDNHFNHWNINRYCHRGYSTLEAMNADMIKKWNRVVKPNDLVIHLGDIIFTKGESEKIKQILSQLNGRIVLVKGNHDRKSYAFYLANGIDFICERFEWTFNKKNILFIHSPHDITHKDYRTCDYILHGHSHDKGQFIHKNKTCKIVNLSVEQIGFAPMNLVTLLNRLQQGYYDRSR